MFLINPAYEMFGGFLSRYVPVGIPVGIGCIAAYLEKHGVSCAIHDEEIAKITPEAVREKAANIEKPYIFGITCLTAHVGRGYEVARMLKSEFPDCTVVVGGLHPSALPDEALGVGAIDYVIRGEGEKVALQLYRALRGSADPTKTMGISFRRDGKTIHNPDAPLIPDLDMIPAFPYHLFAHPKYDLGFMTTSRGCPYQCAYCSQRLMTGTTYRYKSADRIVEELTVLVDKYKQTDVLFYDDNFCLVKQRVFDLCDKIIASGLNKRVRLSVQSRADNLVERGGEEVVCRMADANFTHMGFGLETGVQRIADLMVKDETVEVHLEASRLCKKYGMDVSLFMIFGFPTETSEDRRTSYEVVRDENILATKFNNIIPYPSTPLWKSLKGSNRVHVSENWSNFNSTLSITRSIFDKTPLPYVPETTSEFELKREVIRYNFKSYLTWSSLSGIFGRTKGGGWYALPERWYLKPRELFEMSKIAVAIGINLLMSSLPLWLTEPLMEALNPELKKRKKVKNYSPESFVPEGWDASIAKAVGHRLSRAREEFKKTGDINVLMNDAISVPKGFSTAAEDVAAFKNNQTAI
ncbi:MAG: hypothetical protein A3G18_03000 [Rhodospirillales bacterium RIFCSPLOWO2_12_FULL_58_28]|nr:MAG: hypothetical protein A3H92_13480 [Rhodospirillales bacterium RIFCSPLOWO2_02_FULL_58_16]OHC77165.1 MAG: hypothetical protein A3G18_03000 [Rhodospirillales bacterium RIFCSPLOWO2_12_FULL_58_28]